MPRWRADGLRYSPISDDRNGISHAQARGHGTRGQFFAATTLATTGPKADGAALREGFTHADDGYEGVTGTTELDAASDRTTAPDAFSSICASGASGTSNGSPKWVRTGVVGAR